MRHKLFASIEAAERKKANELPQISFVPSTIAKNHPMRPVIDMMRKANNGLEKMSNKFSSLERGSSGDDRPPSVEPEPARDITPKRTAVQLMNRYMSEIRVRTNKPMNLPTTEREDSPITRYTDVQCKFNHPPRPRRNLISI